MPTFSDLPNFGGTWKAYGIPPVWLTGVPAGIAPGQGGGKWVSGFDPAWIIPGMQPGNWSQRVMPWNMATNVPGNLPPRAQLSGYLGATPPSPSAPGQPGVSVFDSSSSTSSATGGTASAYGGNASQSITVQGPPPALSGDAGMAALGLAGLGLFGGLLYMASKK